MQKQKVEAKIPQKHNPSSWLDLATACFGEPKKSTNKD